jgi:hypothetical protein
MVSHLSATAWRGRFRLCVLDVYRYHFLQAITTPFGILALASTTFRIYDRCRKHGLWWDDYWAILSQLSNLVNGATIWFRDDDRRGSCSSYNLEKNIEDYMVLRSTLLYRATYNYFLALRPVISRCCVVSSTHFIEHLSDIAFSSAGQLELASHCQSRVSHPKPGHDKSCTLHQYASA